jgi:signal transduction histidine kinase
MLTTVPLMPHAVCWASAPRLIWTMVITNLITFLSYLAICFTLFYLSRRTGRVIARDWKYFLVGFALFIVSCGSTHLLEVVTTWWPVFWIDAWTNIITAALSAYVAVMLIRRVGQVAFGINDYAGRLANTENEKQRMEESLLSAQRLEEWSRLSAAVSHEIRGPIEAIQNLQYLIRTTNGISPEIASLTRETAEEASRLLTISESALSFIRQGKNREPIDICAALESVRFVLNPIIRKKGIEFTVNVQGDCIVEAFAGETRQVLLNIVRNACEAISRPGGHVTVAIKGESEGVEVVVIDEGVGIEPAVMARIFNFGVTTKGEEGNGMGLWMVKHILTKYGGDIKVDSGQGKGTRFRLWWPRAVAASV